MYLLAVYRMRYKLHSISLEFVETLTILVSSVATDHGRVRVHPLLVEDDAFT